MPLLTSAPPVLRTACRALAGLLLAATACGGEAGRTPTAAPAKSTATPSPTPDATPTKSTATTPTDAAKAQGAALTASGAPPPTRVPAPRRLVALGDVHGDLAATRAALKLAGAIDDADQWIGGDLVVVQTGDQLDRGDDEREILDLLARLREQAAAAGGALYILNGNHELMNAGGDLRYVTAGGFLDFADVPGVDLRDPAGQSVPEQVRGRFLAFAPGGPYARELARRNVVMVVGDSVFVHGGVLPEHARRGLDTINQETQAWLRGEAEVPVDVVTGDESPVWTRLYSDNPSPAACATLAEALAAIPAARMVVGHTVHKDGVTSACDGKVWMIDVGMAAYYGGRPAVLEIVGDAVRVIQ
ncbi:MAG: metallophosphoesterase [Nannocystaceae bacterium]